LQSGEARVVRYDSMSDDDIIFGTGLGCNGIIDVFIEPITKQFSESFINAVKRCQKTRQSGAVATVIEDCANHGLSGQHAFLVQGRWTGNERLTSLLEARLTEIEGPILLSGETSCVEARVFVQPLLPPIQLVIFGGWLDVVPLIRIAREIGFEIVVVDSRQRPSSQRFFREANSVLLCSPAEALPHIQFDPGTVAVLMNHNFERDQEALAALTQVSVPYVGMLGPKRRQEKILDAVKSNGVSISDEFAQRLHGPVGLDIGAKSPEEIALSILAEILSALNGGNAKPSRERKTPLHIASPILTYA
jgi:xanthine dehydrogenase accessory factor